MMVENVVNGFCHSSIYPLEPQKVDDRKFAPVSLFKKEDLMPNVNASINKGRVDDENTHQENDGDE